MRVHSEETVSILYIARIERGMWMIEMARQHSIFPVKRTFHCEES
jgi:hypothetical protein